LTAASLKVFVVQATQDGLATLVSTAKVTSAVENVQNWEHDDCLSVADLVFVSIDCLDFGAW